jgi:hypothetical protein
MIPHGIEIRNGGCSSLPLNMEYNVVAFIGFEEDPKRGRYGSWIYGRFWGGAR